MRGRFLGAWAAALFPVAAGAVSIDLVTVGDPGNAPDPLNTNAVPGIGSVGYAYQIGKFEVRNSEYVDFLNAVADTDTYGLYSTAMSTDDRGGITRSGSSGSYTYAAKPGYEDRPVIIVSLYDAVRFVNWLENGQPVGAQGAGITETGTYTLFTSGTATTNVGARAANATWMLPTEDEWYKAAYYQPAADGGPSDSYWLYPTQSDSALSNDLIDPDPGNNANFRAGTTDFTIATDDRLTDVGAFENSGSYYGTFDQAGNLYEWSETFIPGPDGGWVHRGGAWNSYLSGLSSSQRNDGAATAESVNVGFRVAAFGAIPEPGAFVALGVAGLGACAWARRLRGRPRIASEGRGVGAGTGARVRLRREPKRCRRCALPPQSKKWTASSLATRADRLSARFGRPGNS